MLVNYAFLGLITIDNLNNILLHDYYYYYYHKPNLEIKGVLSVIEFNSILKIRKLIKTYQWIK